MAGVLTAVLAAASLSAVAAPAAAVESGALPHVALSDISGNPFEADIQWMADSGISTGYPDGTFRPAANVSRQAMAAFMYRFAGSPAFTPPVTSPFNDVATDSTFYLEITWMADQGISTGYADGGFHPAANVSRQAMAAFMYRLAGSPAFTPPVTSPFNDVATDSTFYLAITWMADAAISTGYADSGFHPAANVSRQAMAAFMHRLDSVLTVSIESVVAPAGTAGLPYLLPLTVGQGRAPYIWQATGLPDGLSIDADGVIRGTPTGTGSAQATITVTDANSRAATASVPIDVPESLPGGCVGSDCSIVTAEARTFEIPATRIGAITLDGNGAPTSVLLSGDAPQVDDILVLAPTVDVPSGVVVVVISVTPNPDATTTVGVAPADFADAYADGAIKSTGTVPTTELQFVGAATNPLVLAPRGTENPDKAAAAQRTAVASGFSTATVASAASAASAASVASVASPASMSCSNGVTTDLRGLTVTPSLTPSLAAIWHRPLIGIGGVYVGTGGLELFQFDLNGKITVDLGVRVSGAATCTLTLPTVIATAPAGATGAVILKIDPSITFEVTGVIDLRTSVTLTCGSEYRWDEGVEFKVSYCGATSKPLQLSADTGVTASVTGALDASVTWNGLAGVTGNISAKATATYQPAQHPVATLSARSDFELGLCVACFWKGTPAHVTVASGTIFDKVIKTWDTTPPRVAASAPPVITTTSLANATVGVPYSQRLRTADNRNGTWSMASGSLPPGLQLSGDTITGKATGPGSFNFVVSFVDLDGLTDTQPLLLIVGSQTGTDGAIMNADYCFSNVLDRNDDGASGAVPLPFGISMAGVAYQHLYVSNNGYVTFSSPLGTYTPYPLANASQPMIAPLFADVDTRAPDSAMVTYGASPDGSTFCVNWVGVGYYDSHSDKTNSFQLLLTTRPDAGAGAFDITFNYGHVSWETGDASGGIGGIGGTAARAGYTDGSGPAGTWYELPGSGQVAALVDGGTSALISGSQGSPVPGRYVFEIRG